MIKKTLSKHSPIKSEINMEYTHTLLYSGKAPILFPYQAAGLRLPVKAAILFLVQD